MGGLHARPEDVLAVQAPCPQEDHHRLLQEGRVSGQWSGAVVRGRGRGSGQGQGQGQWSGSGSGAVVGGKGQGQGRTCRKAMQAESAKSTALR